MEQVTIECAPDYKIDIEGNVYSKHSNKLLKGAIEDKGYRRLCLMVNGVRKNLYLHRLIASAFKPNPNNYQFVDHINGIRTDNRIDNLNWVNAQQNQHNMRSAKGYCFDNQKNKWKAYIKCDCKAKHLGFFDTEAEAHQAYCTARLERNSGSGATIKDY